MWGKLAIAILRKRGARYIPTRVGKTEKEEEINTSTRYIPTRVGKTAVLITFIRKSPVHPHACGENGCINYVHSQISGTSPRVWGKRIVNSLRVYTGRYIPTRVGKTQHIIILPVIYSVHPHACGENLSPVCHSRYFAGTSPRVWGKLRLLKPAITGGRYIPTRVGKTHAGHIEPLPVMRYIPTRVGNPPLNCDVALKNVRYIPTRVGKTLWGRISASTRSGTSPRVWGKRISGELGCPCDRYIPTRVGKTPIGPLHLFIQSGTSPRVWGKLTPVCFRAVPLRYIPTRVGKTR